MESENRDHGKPNESNQPQGQNAPLALYIHWPFCKAKCPYCDFNSHVRKDAGDASWVQALIKEMHYWHQHTRPRPLTSIFFGGGTPSLLPPHHVEQLLTTAQNLWGFASTIEISLEANPTSSEGKKFQDFAAAGINRLSLGVQALDDAALKFLGREHNVDEALRAVDLARRIFPRFSFDLIYARKNQTAAAWEDELKRALSLCGTHVSLYQLTLEPNTVFATKAKEGAVFQAPDDEAARMYEITNQLTADAALPFYEVSNYAKTGHECRHNLTYWHYGEYIGVGAGAHGRIVMQNQLHATATYRAPDKWRDRVMQHGHGLETNAALSLIEQKEEALMMGLRLKTGLTKAAWRARFGDDVNSLFNPQKYKMLVAENYLQKTDDYLRITQDGFLKLTAITGALLA